MKKSLLFIVFIASMVSFGIFQNSKTEKTSNINTEKDAFAKKMQGKAERAAEFFEWRQNSLRNVETGEVDSKDYLKALKEVNELKEFNAVNKSANAVGLEWISRGPDNQGGRTRAMLFDKDDANLVYAGSVSGGLFKSTNAGLSWERLTTFKDATGDYINPSIGAIEQGIDGAIYVGTGEFLGVNPQGSIQAPSYAGNGVYKSTDNGLTWTVIDDTHPNTIPTNSGEWAGVASMATHPLDKDILLIGNKNNLRFTLNATDPQPTISNTTLVNGVVSDVQILENQDGWAAASGRIYFKAGINATNLNSPWSNVGPSVPGGASRAQLAISSLENGTDYIVYASFTNSGGCLAGVYKSEDKGATWTRIIAPGSLDPFTQPSGGGCQGWYDHCIAVNPKDKNKIYIGGITFYTWSPTSGGMKRADQIGSEGAGTFDPNYIHADKHNLFFNPHDETGNTLFIVGDGGISRTTNALDGFPDDMVYTENNKGYVTFQAIGIGSGKYGEVIAGAQDNGTMYTDYTGISPLNSKRVSGGDGVNGAEISNLSLDVLFSGVYYGQIRRSLTNGTTTANAFVDGVIDEAHCDKMSCNPLPPNTTCESLSSGGGQGFFYPFLLMETYARKTPIEDAYVYARKDTINLPDGSQTYIFDTIQPGNMAGHEQLVYPKMPGLDTAGFDLKNDPAYQLNTTLYPGDTFKILNKFDAKYFVPSTCGSDFFVCTNPLQADVLPRFSKINVTNQSSIKRLDHSFDGDMVAGVGSRLIIMQGWDAYDPDTNPNAVSVVQVQLPINNLQGVSIDKNDKSRILVSQGGYGGVSKIYLVTGADTNSPTYTSVQGNLPIMPIYSCVIDKADGNRFIVGTEFGIFVSTDGGATWEEENGGVDARLPVYAVRQEWVNKANDCDILSMGTLGGGMYTCGTLTSCEIVYGRPEKVEVAIKDLSVEVEQIIVYPNPVEDVATIGFNLTKASDVTIKIIDLSGKVVFNKSLGKMNAGEQKIQLDFSKLASSTYFTVLSTSNRTYGNKLFIKK